MFSRKGGKPINSGGYGCIFKPALKCKNSKKIESSSNIMFYHGFIICF